MRASPSWVFPWVSFMWLDTSYAKLNSYVKTLTSLTYLMTAVKLHHGCFSPQVSISQKEPHELVGAPNIIYFFTYTGSQWCSALLLFQIDPWSQSSQWRFSSFSSLYRLQTSILPCFHFRINREFGFQFKLHKMERRIKPFYHPLPNSFLVLQLFFQSL